MIKRFMRISSVGILALAMMLSITPVTNIHADETASAGDGILTRNAAAEWSEVQGLIDNAAANETIDITELCFTTANTTLTISKNITIKCDPANEAFDKVVIKNLFFDVNNNATLILDNVAIENTKLDTSVISGNGNVVISESILQPSTAYGTTTVYNPPATIDVVGDVTVMTDADWSSCIVAGASIIERNSTQTGKAGAGIKAANVIVNGGHVVGGASFESGCDSGDGIIASGNVIINGTRQNDNSNALVQSGSIGINTLNTTVGLPIRFTDSTDQRVLFVQGGDVFGSTRSTNGSAAPYTIKLSASDIAIIDNSKIGWYTDIPVFSDGYFSISNSVATWGTTEGAQEIYSIQPTSATLTGTKTVTLGEETANYAQMNTIITITADPPAAGKQFKAWTVSSGVTLADSNNATTTFTMPGHSVAVAATYEEKQTTDKEKIDEAKPLAISALEKITATNNTTSVNILDAVNAGIASVNGVTAIWKAEPTIVKATISNAGSIAGIIKLACGSETVEIAVNKSIEKLPAPTPEIPTITVGDTGSDHQISSGENMTFTCTGKLEDLTGIYVDGKLVDSSNYTLKGSNTVLTLKAGYLDTLSIGKHTLSFQYKNNLSAAAEFTVTAEETTAAPTDDEKTEMTPETGDTTNSLLLFCLLILSGGAIIIVFFRKKRIFN